MCYLAFAVSHHIGPFITSHADILHWLAGIDRVWGKARLKAAGGWGRGEGVRVEGGGWRRGGGAAGGGGFSLFEETKPAFKLGPGKKNLTLVQSATGIAGLLLPGVMGRVCWQTGPWPIPSGNLIGWPGSCVHAPNEQVLEGGPTENQRIGALLLENEVLKNLCQNNVPRGKNMESLKLQDGQVN